jgi:hypothetical protein
MTREELIVEGLNLIKQFCELNNIPQPKIELDQDKPAKYCGTYNTSVNLIKVFPKACARPAINPVRSWSFPHYFVDKTVLGVICHEFGHYVHCYLGTPIMDKLGLQITGYEPNMYERFAETMKVFLTNPDLLKQYNPERYNYLTIELKLKPVYTSDWKTQLCLYGEVNEKYIKACENRIKSANKSKSKRK